MSLLKLILGIVLVLAATAHAQDVKCPSYHGKNPLSGVSIFDGPPAEKADLAPDIEKGSGDHIYTSWDVSDLHGTGRDLFLVCRFAGLGDAQSVTIKLDKKVRKCFYRSHSAGLPAEAECN